MQDKFNEAKDKFSDKGGDMKDDAEDLYNKAKESPAGDKIEDVQESAKEKAHDAAGRMRGDRGERGDEQTRRP
jgi:hypothetical protein